METAKERILARIRQAVATSPEPATTPAPFRTRDEREHPAILADFIERLLDYKALVTRSDPAHLAEAILAAYQERGMQNLVVPADVPES